LKANHLIDLVSALTYDTSSPRQQFMTTKAPDEAGSRQTVVSVISIDGINTARQQSNHYLVRTLSMDASRCWSVTPGQIKRHKRNLLALDIHRSSGDNHLTPEM